MPPDGRLSAHATALGRLRGRSRSLSDSAAAAASRGPSSEVAGVSGSADLWTAPAFRLEDAQRDLGPPSESALGYLPFLSLSLV